MSMARKKYRVTPFGGNKRRNTAEQKGLNMSATKKSVTVDVDAMVAAMAKLIDSKIEAALGNAAKGAPIYAPAEAVPAPEAKAKPKQDATTPTAVTLGDIEIRFDSVSARGNRYKNCTRIMLVDTKTGARVLLIGGKYFPVVGNEIPDGIEFIAGVK